MQHWSTQGCATLPEHVHLLGRRTYCTQYGFISNQSRPHTAEVTGISSVRFWTGSGVSHTEDT